MLARTFRGNDRRSRAVTIFTVVTVFVLGYGVLLALFVKPVRKLMAGVH